jgi:hypothetical protein
MTATVTTADTGPFAPDGVTTAFPFTFKAMSAAEVAVVRLATTGAQTAMSGYSVALNPDGGGTVNFSVAPIAGDPIYIYSDPSFEQQIDFANQGNFSPTSVNSGFDRSAVRDIYMLAHLARAFMAPLGETIPDLPSAASRANAFLAFDGAGNPIASTAVGAKGDPGSPGEGYATRTAMAARLLPTVLDDVYLTEKGREGKFVVDLASNWTAAITADTAQGIFVKSTADATKVYVRTEALIKPWNAGWFGVKFDDQAGTGTDNLSAINAMLAVAGVLGTSKPRAGVTTERPGITIEFPGYFYVSDTVNLTTQVHLKGFSSGPTGGKFTRWRVPSGKAALVVNHFGTFGYATAFDGTKTTSAASSIIEGIFFLGGTEGIVGGGAAYDDTATADGILIRAFGVTIRNCRIEAFKRNGIAIYAGTDANPIYGNANSWLIERCSVYYCGLHGVHVKGTDANTGEFHSNDCSFNRRWGVLEESFLGNLYMSRHCAGNGVGNGTTDIDSVVAYPAGGQRYAVVYGQETAASTTQPGTNGSVWAPINGATNGRTWVSGITVRSGGGCSLRSVSIDFNGYSEGGQGPDQCLSPSLTIGGVKGADGTAFFGGVRLRADLGNIVVSGGLDTADRISISGSASGLIINSRDTGSAYQLFNSAGVLGFHNGTMRVQMDAAGNVNLATGVLKVGNTQVLSTRDTGWAADTGTAKKTSNATYLGTAEATYTQATIQALMDKVRDLSQTIKSLKDALLAHGVVGA